MELVLVTTLATARQDTREQDVKKQVRTSVCVNHLHMYCQPSMLRIYSTLQPGNLNILPVILTQSLHWIVLTDECESDICENGGTCRRLAEDYVCLCPQYYIGLTCAERKNGGPSTY